jgi:hypothetical protein
MRGTVNLCIYDASNYYFEIDEPDELRKYGVSKEHKYTSSNVSSKSSLLLGSSLCFVLYLMQFVPICVIIYNVCNFIF